jgi:hypothetical protein
MTNWPAHPDDEWVELERFGDPVPTRILARSGVDKVIGAARAAYVEGHITIEEFTARLDAACSPSGPNVVQGGDA